MGRKPNPRGKMEQITVSIPSDLLDEMMKEANSRGMSRSAMNVLMIDMYFRDQRIAPAPVHNPQSGLFDELSVEVLKAIRDQLASIEKKADRSIEVGLSTREAVRAVPDLIREDLSRHMENLRNWAAEVMKTGSETLLLVSEQLEEILVKMKVTGRNLVEIWKTIGGKPVENAEE